VLPVYYMAAVLMTPVRTSHLTCGVIICGVILFTVKPAAVSSLRVSNKTSTSLLLVWNEPDYIDYIKTFQVRVNYSSDCTSSSLVSLPLTAFWS